MNTAPGIPTLVHNLRLARGWRPRDMLNWHRMARPIAELSRGRQDFDFYRLMFDMCSRMAILYEPEPGGGAPPVAVGESPEYIAASYVRGEPRVGLFVDAPEHLSGVSATIGEWAAEARRRSLTLRVHAATRQCAIPGSVCFKPLGTFRLSSYAGLDVSVPQVGEVLDHVRRESFDVIHVSTPGPMGLLGLLSARLLRLPICATFHTHFPHYAGRLTGDAELEQAAWRFMRWFYGEMDHVATPSLSTLVELRDQGLDPARLSVVGRGVDIQRFSPGLRDEVLRAEWGPHRFKLLYVGRLSKEKNVHALASSFKMLAALRDNVALVLTGEGPEQARLASALEGWPVTFTGPQRGSDLARVYASADLFVFPSETDTLGRVVLEAQASGLPLIVSSQGGPKDCILPGRSGVVLPEMTPDALCRTMDLLLESPALRQSMGAAARRHALTWTPQASFDAFWEIHRRLNRPSADRPNGDALHAT